MSRVMISLSDEFLKEMDQLAQLERRSRSELLREAMRFYFTQRPLNRRGVPLCDTRVCQAVKQMDELAQKDRTPWNSTAAIRSWRKSH